MDRRRFLEASGIGVIGLALRGCSSVTEVDGGDPSAEPTARAGRDPDEDGRDDVFGIGDDHLVFDDDGVAYRLDPIGHRVEVLDDDGRVVGSFGSLGEDNDELNYPIAAVVSGRRLYVLDRGNFRVQVFDLSGRHVATIGGRQVLLSPNDLALDRSGNIYVADTGHHRVQVFDPRGQPRSVIGEFGVEGAGLNGPRSLAITPDGELHVVDFGNARIQVFSLDGSPRYAYGGYGDERGQFIAPSSIVADRRGRTFVSDPVTGRISVFGPGGTFERRFRPRPARGERAVPARLELTHDDRLYVWTAGHDLPPE